MTLPCRRRPLPATAAIAAAAAVVVAADLLGSPVGEFLRGGLLLLVLAILAADRASWVAARNGRLAAGLVLLAGAIAVLAGVPASTLLGGAAGMIPPAVLLVATGTVRPAFAICGLDRYLAAAVTGLPARLRATTVDTFATTTSLAAGFGSIAMLGSALGERASPAAAAANASMRGLSISMLLGPSIASVAAIRAALPPTSWFDGLVTALPLVGAALVINALLTPAIRLELAPGGARGAALPHRRAIPMLASVPAIAAAATGLAGIGPTEAITLACLFTGIGLAYGYGGGQVTARLDRDLAEGWRRCQPEIALFLASGALASLLQDPTITAAVRPLAALFPSGDCGILLLVTLVPAIAMLGVHPMPLFAVVAPLVPAGHLGVNAVGLYQLWVVTIGLSLLLSPASILTSLTVSAFRVRPHEIGLRRNLAYAALVAGAALFLVPMLNPPALGIAGPLAGRTIALQSR